MNSNKCFTIGLTGGIASGKSAASRIFEELGCAVIDADIIARDVVKPNSKGLAQLVEQFGMAILTKDRHLNRKKLREIVFNNSKKLSQINSILHPLIQSTIIDKVRKVKNSYCIIVIPLLCESSHYDWLDRILVIDVKPEIQMQRLLMRDSITENLAKKMIQSQCPREQRLAIANDVIANEKSLTELSINIGRLNSLYKKL